MTINLIVHPHEESDISKVFCQKGNEVAGFENSVTIVRPNIPSYIIKPRNPPLASETGSINEEIAVRIIKDGHAAIMGGVHGFCPYDTLDSIIKAFILFGRDELKVSFPMHFIYCKIDNQDDQPWLLVGKVKEFIEGEWGPFLVYEEDKVGRRRASLEVIPLVVNPTAYTTGTYILGEITDPTLTNHELFQPYIHLLNLWANIYTSIFLRRHASDKKIRFKYATEYNEAERTFTVNMSKVSSSR